MSEQPYTCAHCLKEKTDGPVIKCGIPDEDRDLVFTFCPACWRVYPDGPPPITLKGLSDDVQRIILLSGVPVR